MKCLILLGIALTHFITVAEVKTFDARELSSLRIQNLSGPISISSNQEQQARVKFVKSAWAKGCKIDVGLQFEVLSVVVEDTGVNSFSRDNCKVSFQIEVPAKTQIEVKNGSGNVSLAGIRGAIDFKLGSGDLKISSTETPKVSGTAGSGDIEIVGGVGSTSLRTGSGDIRITYNNSIEEGLIDIKTGSGDAEISLPQNMKILTDFKAGSGAIESEFGSDSEAKFKVSMRAGSGDLKIRKN